MEETEHDNDFSYWTYKYTQSQCLEEKRNVKFPFRGAHIYTHYADASDTPNYHSYLPINLQLKQLNSTDFNYNLFSEYIEKYRTRTYAIRSN